MPPLHRFIIGKIKKIINENSIAIICIDGPTASGKTILAEELAETIKDELSIDVDFYRLDWTLKERKTRELDLKNLMQDDKPFLVEGELHMELSKFKNFLKEIQFMKKNHFSISNKRIDSLTLKNLYSRKNEGKCLGQKEYTFSSNKKLIICEGHYTSRSEFRNLIDYNICLLADKAELLRRKINRVKGYRSPQKAIDYFEKIDIPSFSYHISRFHKNIDLLVDNTNYEKPSIINYKKISNWFISNTETNINKNKIYINNEINFNRLYQEIFSRSNIFNSINLIQFKRIFNLYKFLDKLISKKLQNNVNSSEDSIQETLIKEIRNISISNNVLNKDLKLEIASSSSLYDVYQRKIPVSIGINIKSAGNSEIGVHFNININFAQVLFIWDGGAYEIKVNRALNTLENIQQKETIEFSNYSLKSYCKNKEFRNKDKVIYSPTDFCIPAFLKDEKFDFVYTGREHELTSIFSIFKKVIDNPESIFCHRISLYSELNFFKKILESCGINCLTIANYIIGINTSQRDLIDAFNSWSRNWISVDKNNKIDQKNYDSKIYEEIIEANNLVSKSYKSFIMIDSFLFEKENKNNLDNIIKDLKEMLLSNNRIIRKRAFQFIINGNEGLQLNTQHFLKINDIESKDNINKSFQLSDLPEFYPSIMSELYLWLQIREDNSAILGANVYDIDGCSSYDIEAILESASLKSTPVVIQSSFNAIGQKEFYKDKEYNGYLKIENGPSELVESCIKTNIKNVLVKGIKRTFYGIGLDHIDARNDKPEGRAKRFLENAIRTEQITHIVLDGSYLFKAEDRSSRTINNAYKRVSNYATSLLDTKGKVFLIDLEYCVGEMNYIGNRPDAMVPSSNEIRLFTNLVRSKLTSSNKGHFNCRPNLFIGNVGTTHHTDDENIVDSSISSNWVDNVKDQNFISAVLHGTTNSNSSILKHSTKGCHKVNVAGDFLNIYQSSLPENLPKRFREFNPNSKYQMSEIRGFKNKIKTEEEHKIISNLKKRTDEIIDVINSPKLTNKDLDYFHRSSYKFNNSTIDYILSIFHDAKKNLSVKKFKLKNYKSISFSSSMIEVPYEENFIEIANELIKLGLKFFHIDVGDGKFISRKFSGLKKLEYLYSLNSKIKIHTHLMVQDPFSRGENNKSYIDSYIESGTTSLGLHTRSFRNKKSLKKALEYIKSLGCRPGIVIEVNQSDFLELWNLIEYLEIDWVIIMGVPIGYGGQLFQSKSLKKIHFLREMSLKNKLTEFDIEIDGGLTFNNLNDCFNSGANIFAGWSIIKDKNLSKIYKNYAQLNKQLSI